MLYWCADCTHTLQQKGSYSQSSAIRVLAAGPPGAQMTRSHTEHHLTRPVPVLLPSEWTWLRTSSPPGALLCATWAQAGGWFQGCSPTCWLARGAPAPGAPAFPRTPHRLTRPPRRSWRRTTTAARSTLESISSSTDTQRTPTVSPAHGLVQTGHVFWI